METTTKKILCDQCKKSVPFSSIRYLLDKKNTTVVVCSECRNKKKLLKEETNLTRKEPGKKTFFCVNCRYKFKYDPKGISNLKCPYCGEDDNIIEHKVPTADELIEDS